MRFGILNDLLGQRDDVPHIKLPQALAADESQWCYYWRNAVRRLPGWLKAFTDASGTQVTCPYATTVYWIPLG
jgi:hypothetical protein